MSGTESDTSLETEEMNALNDEIKETFEPETKAKIERQPKKKTKKKPKETPKEVIKEVPIKVKKKKEAKVYVKEEKPKRKIKKVIYEDDTESEEEIVEPPPKAKKKLGRPPIPIEEKLAKQVITKEKIIYMIQDEDGNYIKKEPKKLTARELKKIEREKEAREKEIELGRRLKRLKSGKPKLPKPRSEAQIANTKRLVEQNKQKKIAKKEVKKQDMKEVVKESVKESVIEVVSQPAIVRPPKEKTLDEQYAEFFG